MRDRRGPAVQHSISTDTHLVKGSARSEGHGAHTEGVPHAALVVGEWISVRQPEQLTVDFVPELEAIQAVSDDGSQRGARGIRLQLPSHVLAQILRRAHVYKRIRRHAMCASGRTTHGASVLPGMPYTRES
jgi:hypothetical protein